MPERKLKDSMENLSNDFKTSLAAGITGVATTLSVLSSTNSPVESFRIRIDDELMLVTNKGAGAQLNWTVERGVEGTIPTDHLSGAEVFHVLTAQGLEQFLNDRMPVQPSDADIAAGTSNTPIAPSPSQIKLAVKTFARPRIRNASKIQRLFSALMRGRYERINLGFHGMSITFGVGADDNATFFGGAAGRNKAMAPLIGGALNNVYGEKWSSGVDVIANNTGTFSVSGGAAFSAAYTSIGAQGLSATLNSGYLQFVVTGGYAGQKVRVYAVANPSSAPYTTPISAQYSMSGSNTVAQTNAPASAGTDLTPFGTQHWYEFDLTLPNAGDTTIRIYNPSSGGTVVPYAVDLDYRGDAGITLHRLARSGTGIANCCGWALDNTDTQPAGNWIGSDAATANRRATQLLSMTTRLKTQAVICSFDVNDITQWNSLGYSLADHTRHITNYVNAINALDIPVLFVCGHLRDPSSVTAGSGTAYTQQDIIDAYKSVSDASNAICGAAFIDLSSEYSGLTLADRYTEQWRDTTMRISGESPSLHPNGKGHANYAAKIASAIIDAAQRY